MSTLLDTVTDLETRALDAYARAQEPIVSAVRRGAALLEDRIPELPTDRLTRHLPTAREVVDTRFAAAGRFLDTTHELTLAVLEAAAPVTVKVVRPTAAQADPPTRTTRKSAGKAEAA